MCVSGKSRGWIGPVAFTSAALMLLASTSATAEPVRITVDFRVSGDHDAGGTSPADPVHGRASAKGYFSIVTHVPAGGGKITDFERGLGADVISFSWAGSSWTSRTADVSALVFDPRGALVYWQIAGVTAGLGEISSGTAPDIYIDPFAFLYVTGRTMFQGSVTSTGMRGGAGVGTMPGSSHDPNPVPEPLPFALVASGLVALFSTPRLSRG